MSTLKYKRLRGSIIVDAACCLPVFIIAMCVVLMLIAEAGIEDTVTYVMTDAAGETVRVIAAADGSDDDTGVPAKAAAYAAFAASMRFDLNEEWNSDSSPAVRLSNIDFDLEDTLSDGTVIDSMISAEVSYSTRIPVVGSFISRISANRTILFRPWVGESRQVGEFDDTRVYIFPKRGEHYHNASCSCLKNGEIQVVLTPSLRKKYRGCTTCHAGQLPDGSAVFLMSGSSEAFHRKSCPCIAKAFECVALSDAVSMGYSACGLCGGTADNYKPENDLFR